MLVSLLRNFAEVRKNPANVGGADVRVVCWVHSNDRGTPLVSPTWEKKQQQDTRLA